MHSKCSAYCSSTGSKTAALIVQPVIRSSGSPAPWRSKCTASAQYVGAGRGVERLVALAAERLASALLGSGALAQPRDVVVPPRALVLGRLAQPRLGVGRVGVVDLVAGLLVAGRVDQRGDVPAGGEHEARVGAEQLRRAVVALPRRDVVGDAGHLVGVDGDLPEVDRRAQHRAL